MPRTQRGRVEEVGIPTIDTSSTDPLTGFFQNVPFLQNPLVRVAGASLLGGPLGFFGSLAGEALGSGFDPNAPQNQPAPPRQEIDPQKTGPPSFEEDLHPIVRDILGQQQAAEEAAQAEDIAVRGGETNRIQSQIDQLTQQQNQIQQLIANAQATLKAQFDPVLGQFQDLFDQPAIDAGTQRRLLANIRGGTSAAAATGREDVSNILASRGLSGSSIEARELGRVTGETLRTRLGAENELAGAIADLNMRQRIAGAQGLLGATTGLAGGQLGLLGAGVGADQFSQGLSSQLTGAISDINLGRDLTPFDILPYFGLSEGLKASEAAEERADEAAASEGNLAQQFLESIFPQLTFAFLRKAGLPLDFLAGF